MQQKLLEWYRDNQRELPWRAQPTPYRVWLSEIMCQQTRIQTALPYFERFLARWPTVFALADAELDEVLQEWAGLGYYSRARSLHRAAILVSEMGAFPNTEKGLLKLPGVGPYTAAAIASIAFEQDAHLADGNVERVLTRYFGIELDVRSTAGKKAVWQKAKELFPAGKGRDWNQALMEWGALVCHPRNPDCPLCPTKEGCVAKAQGKIAVLPYKARRPKTKEVWGVSVVIEHKGQVLLRKRSDKGLLAGLWEFPSSEFVESPDPTLLAKLLESLPGVLKQTESDGEYCGQVRHIFTHRKLSLKVYRFRLEAPMGIPSKSTIRMCSEADLSGLGLPRLTQKVWELASTTPAAD